MSDGHSFSERAPRGVRVRAFRPRPRDLRALIELGAPVTLVQLGLMSMGAVDTLMVGRVSAAGLAAVALGNLYFLMMAVFGQGVLFALDPVIAQSVGARDLRGVAHGVQRGLVLALGLAAVSMLLMIPVGPLLILAGQPTEVVPIAVRYVQGLILGVFPFYAFGVFRQSLQAMGRVRAIVFTVLAANVLNAVLNWILIFGNLGFPRLGAVGSAWGTSVSRWFLLFLLLALAWSQLRATIRPWRRTSFALAPIARFLRLGAPIGAQQLLEFGVFGAAGLLMGLFGTVAMASHQVALQLAALTFMIPVGVAQATSVVVGQAVGRGEPEAARRAVGAGLVTVTGFMTVTAVTFVALPIPLARIFSTDQVVVAAAATLLPIAGVFQIFDGLQVASAGALRGIADTRVPMLMNLVGFWLIGLPVSAFLGFTLDMGPQGVWWGLAVGIGVVAILLLARVRRRFLRSIQRLVIDSA